MRTKGKKNTVSKSKPKRTKFPVPVNGNGHNGNGHNGNGRALGLLVNELDPVADAMDANETALPDAYEQIVTQRREVNEAILQAETENEIEMPKLMRIEASHLKNIVDPKKRAFIMRYSERGIITDAQQFAGVAMGTPYNWLANDPEFKKVFALAKQVSCDNLEAEIWRRGHRGLKTPVYHQGRLCGFERKYSDTLLIFASKGNMPEKYKETSNTNNFNGPIEVTVSFGDSSAHRQAGFIIEGTAEEVRDA